MNSLNYITFFENINVNTPIEEYEKVFVINASFKDPFHEVEGLDKIYNIFQNMYKKLDNPNFKILEFIEQNNILYIKWDFQFKFKNDEKFQSFEGVSRVEFNDNGKAISHVDYWDSVENLYEKIPILSSIMKFIKQRFKN